MTTKTDDEAFMAAALALGARGLGTTWPNPAVGCVIVNNNRIVGRGWTQPGGRPHAETEALGRAGAAARNATAYVTLEPCSNYGRTPPCSRALIEAGIARVVVGCVDPDPRVNGSGLDGLRDAGIEVTTGVLEARCLDSHIGLYRRIQDKRPAITLKLAQSLDGRIALADGRSKWLTGELARRHAHRLRAEHDGIMIGSGTALADDPMLDCRIEGMESHSPVRLVVDRRGRLPVDCKLVATARERPLWVVGTKRTELLEQCVEFVEPAGELTDMFMALAERQLTRVLVEGGSQLAASLIRADLVDRLEIFTCPKLLGGDAIPAIGELARSDLAKSGDWSHIDARELGSDRLDIYRRRRT